MHERRSRSSCAWSSWLRTTTRLDSVARSHASTLSAASFEAPSNPVTSTTGHARRFASSSSLRVPFPPPTATITIRRDVSCSATRTRTVDSCPQSSPGVRMSRWCGSGEATSESPANAPNPRSLRSGATPISGARSPASLPAAAGRTGHGRPPLTVSEDRVARSGAPRRVRRGLVLFPFGPIRSDQTRQGLADERADGCVSDAKRAPGRPQRRRSRLVATATVLELPPMASPQTAASCLRIGCHGRGGLALPLVVLSESKTGEDRAGYCSPREAGAPSCFQRAGHSESQLETSCPLARGDAASAGRLTCCSSKSVRRHATGPTPGA